MEIRYSDKLYVRVYNSEETEKLFRPLAESMVVNKDDPENYLCYVTEAVGGWKFASNPLWKTIAFSADIWWQAQTWEEELWPEGFSREFMESLHQYKSRNEQRQRLWSPVNPLWATVAEDEVDEIIFMLSPYSSEAGSVAAPPLSQFITATRGEELAHFGGIAFTRKANWIAASYDDSPALLAGESDFIDRVVKRAGGLDILKLLLEDYYMSFDDYDRKKPGPFVSPELDHGESIYKATGWAPPDIIREWSARVRS